MIIDGERKSEKMSVNWVKMGKGKQEDGVVGGVEYEVIENPGARRGGWHLLGFLVEDGSRR